MVTTVCQYLKTKPALNFEEQNGAYKKHSRTLI